MLDGILTYKEHCHKTRAKVATWNNWLQKLANSHWGANLHTLYTSALALCYSTVEYACSTWCRSCHSQQVDTALNQTCCIVSGFIRSTPIPCLQALAGIPPPGVRLPLPSTEGTGQPKLDLRHPLHTHTPPNIRLKSRHSLDQIELSQHHPLSRRIMWLEEWKADGRMLRWVAKGITPENL